MRGGRGMEMRVDETERDRWGERGRLDSLPVCLSQPAAQPPPLRLSESARLERQGGLFPLRRLKLPLHFLRRGSMHREDMDSAVASNLGQLILFVGI